jgi:hypothetical protein
LRTPLTESNHCIKRKETTYLLVISILTDKKIFVFYESTTAAGIPLNDEKFGMLYGNHIRGLIRRRTGLSRFQGIIYGLRAKGCYIDTNRGLESYTETIYT